MVERNVLMFLGQGFEDLEAAAVIAACGWTEYREHLPAVRVRITGLHQEVRGRFGTRIRPDLSLGDVVPEDYQALAIPGGFHGHGYDEVFDPAVYDLIRRVYAYGGTLATMCVGVLPVAEAGLLRGKRATTYGFSRNHDNPARLRALGSVPTPGPIEVAGRIISCSGPAQALEVTLLMLERVIGPEHTTEVRRYMAGTTGSRPG